MGDPAWLLPWVSCQLQAVLVCVFSQRERAGQRVGFFPPCDIPFKRKTSFFICSNQKNFEACLLPVAQKASYYDGHLLLFSVSSYEKVTSHLMFKSRIAVGKSFSQVRGKECFLWGGNAEFYFLFQLNMPVFFHWGDTSLLKRLWNSLSGS